MSDRPAAISHKSWARIAVVAAVVLTYWPVLGHKLEGIDDSMNLRGNADFNPPTLRSVLRYWKAPAFDIYAPLTFTVWGALSAVSHTPDAPREHQLIAWPFHAVNVVAHLLTALIVLELLTRLSGSVIAATFGALVFALHPLAVEPVAWASGLKDVLAGMLGLAAILLYLDSRRSTTRYVLACVLLVMSMLAKPSAVVVPAIALLLDAATEPRRLKSALVRSIPWFVLSIPFMVIARRAQLALQITPLSLPDKSLVALDALGLYLCKLLWPMRLASDYGRTPELVIARGWNSLTWIVPIVLLAAAALLFRRSIKPLVALALFVVAVVPMLGLVPFDFQAYSTVADHYAYLALFGAALAVAWLVAHWNRPATHWGAGAVCLILAVLSFRQVWTWRDTRSISEQTLTANPDSWGAHLNLGQIALSEHRLDDALMHARLAAQFKPQASKNQVLLGQAHAALKDYGPAIAAYEAALQLVPTDVSAHVGLADVLADSGEHQRAIDQYIKALQIAPRDVVASSNLASVYAETGNFAQAIRWYDWALAIDPSFAPARSGREHVARQLQPHP